jgi:AmiR/NasT family two-component response regulator
VATNAAAQGEDAAALRRGLASSRAIGKAVGMLMVLNDVSDDAAFDILRRTSQDTNVKLADVAADVVRGRSRPAWKTGAWTSRARAAVARQ